MISKQLDKTQTKSDQTDAQVLIFPARTSRIEGRRIFYLLSVRQVAEVLRQPNILPVPFGPQYAEGVTQWRGRVLPVLSLENCLGIKRSSQSMPLRTIVVRGVTADSEEQAHESYAVFSVGAAVRQLELPFSCEPMAKPTWVSNVSCLHGVYKMQEHLLLALNINEIIGIENSEN